MSLMNAEERLLLEVDTLLYLHVDDTGRNADLHRVYSRGGRFEKGQPRSSSPEENGTVGRSIIPHPEHGHNRDVIQSNLD
jgi:hypothetical protein